MKLGLTFTGDKEMAAAIKAAGERMKAGAKKAVYLAGNAVMTNAKQRAPLDTGVLRASGYVSMPTGPDNHPRVEVGFGGAAGQYALVQHERTEYHHEVGEAKYLEKALNEVPVKAIISETLEESLKGSSAPSVSPGQHRTEPE